MELKGSLGHIRKQTGAITISQINDVLLSRDESIFKFGHMAKLPEECWTADLFDVGYEQDGQFTKLCNLKQHCIGLRTRAGENTIIASDPPSEHLIDVDSSLKPFPSRAVIRIDDPTYACVTQVQDDRSIVEQDQAEATRIFFAIRGEVFASHQEHLLNAGVVVEDLIMITAVEYKRVAYVWEYQGEDLSGPGISHLYFHQEPGADGHWSEEDTPNAAASKFSNEIRQQCSK